MKTATYSVPAMHCDHCIHTVEMEVGDLAGVEAVKADLEQNMVMVRFDEPATEEGIKALLAEIDYPVAA